MAEIDYSNTIFYKIFCKDASNTDLYIGHTTNFVQRKYAHKQGCIKAKCKLYNVIRENNGWDNWTMSIIAFHDCDGLNSAKKKEQEYFEQYKATLNSIEPHPVRKIRIVIPNECKVMGKFYCEKCNYKCSRQYDYKKHLLTAKHLREIDRIDIDTYKCIHCAKILKTCSGLWKHKQKCNVKANIPPPVDVDPRDIMIEDLKNLIVLLVKNKQELL